MQRNEEKEEKIGIIYVRVSSKKQAEEGYSLNTSIDKLNYKAIEFGIKMPYDPITDVVSTKNHISSRLIEILNLAEERKITHLLVIRLDRIGRNPVESLYFVYRLRELGVKIVTEDGEIDVHDIRDLCKAALECLFARMELYYIVERTQGTIKKNFQDGKWNQHIPVGYKKDGKWVSKKPYYKQVIEELHTLYQRGEEKTKIQKHINEKFSDVLDEPIKYHQIDRILEDPIYIGKPSCKDVVVEDPNLQFIDEEKFNKTKNLLKEKKSKGKRKKEETINIEEDLLKKVGYHYTTKHLPIAVLCDECGRPMTKTNGPRKIGDIYRDNYLCQCGRQQTVPTAHQLEHFYSADPFFCPNCGTPDECEEIKGGKWFSVTCRVCGYTFVTDRSTNKFLRCAKKIKTSRRIITSDHRELSDFFSLEE